MIANKELNRLENSAVKLTVTVNQSDVKKEYDTMLSDYAKSMLIKGFRKGKVPPAVLERKFGESLKEEASRNIVEKSLKEIFEEIEEKPLPYSVPEIQDEIKFDLDKDFSFTVVYDIFPEVTLGEYTGIEIEEPVVKITDEDMDRELKALQEQNSIIMDKDEGKVEKDNIVTIDYMELDESGAEVADSRREGFVFTVGSGFNLYRIDDEIIGMAKEEEKDIEKEYPEDFEIKELAGRTVKLHVKVTAIKEKSLPEINDELAQDISDKHETLDDLKADIRKKLEETAAARVREQKVTTILEKISERTEVQIPASMVDLELENTWSNFVNRFRTSEQQVLSLLEAQGRQKEQLVEEWKPEVLKTLKSQLAVQKIMKLEDIEVTDEELDADFARQAESASMGAEEIKDYFTKNNMIDYLKSELKQRKLHDLLMEKAKVVKGKEVDYLDLLKANQ